VVGKAEWKRPLGKPRRRWKDNVRMDLKKIWWMWTGFIWLTIGTSGRDLEHGKGPAVSIKVGNFLTS
jgi:hypothetical protein